MPEALEKFSTVNSLGELLLERGKLTQAGLERAQRLEGESGERLAAVLTKLGLVSERDVAEGLAFLLGIPLIRSSEYPSEPFLVDRLNPKFLKQAQLMPVEDDKDAVTIAMVDPLDASAVQAVRFAVRRPVHLKVALPSEFETAFELLYGACKGTVEPITGDFDISSSEASDDIERLKDLASEAPVIRIVNGMIARAVELGASDIHVEPQEDRLRIRYRIDGVLRDIDAPPARLRAAIVSRLKIMARLNFAERRLAQDGRIRLAVRGKDVDFRVSTTPTMHGESVVLRILDRSSLTLDLPALGFDDEVLGSYLEAIGRPHGMLLVTGPTGSGKTTTLYASLTRLNIPEKKILTIEDPIEYQLAGINQLQVKPQISLTFASALRSFLRQDPDIMMIGEIRDFETAQIAVQAALTGHLILSTLHTNNAASAVTRLLDMGLDDYLLASTIIALVGQRLVRTLCQECRKPLDMTPALEKQLNSRLAKAGPEGTFFQATGCSACNGSGYRGRTTILELLPISERIRELILRHAESQEIQRVAVEEGMRTMHQHGMQKIAAGLTTLEEVMRVTADF